MFVEKEPLNTIVLHPNESELIVGDQSGNIRVFDLIADKCRMKLVRRDLVIIK
jgi:G protein beta subunit-like protein